MIIKVFSVFTIKHLKKEIKFYSVNNNKNVTFNMTNISEINCMNSNKLKIHLFTFSK